MTDGLRCTANTHSVGRGCAIARRRRRRAAAARSVVASDGNGSGSELAGTKMALAFTARVVCIDTEALTAPRVPTSWTRADRRSARPRHRASVYARVSGSGSRAVTFACGCALLTGAAIVAGVGVASGVSSTLCGTNQGTSTASDHLLLAASVQPAAPAAAPIRATAAPKM
jgi:hypothetical protein